MDTFSSRPGSSSKDEVPHTGRSQSKITMNARTQFMTKQQKTQRNRPLRMSNSLELKDRGYEITYLND